MSKHSFKKYQPLSLRLWHWLNAFVILGLLGTVLIRKTLLSWRTNSALIQEKLNNASTTITPELAKEIAVAIRNPLWDWHIYLGYTLSALLIGRIFISLLVEKNSFGLQTFKNIFLIKDMSAADKRGAFHFNLVKFGYLVFYLATALMVVTGLMLTFKVDLGLSKDLAGVTKEIHEVMMWFFVVFIAVHIAGVIFAENSNDPGLVSDMIHGGDPKKK